MDKSHYSVLQQHSRHRQKHGDTNVHYPCFAQCAARPVDRMKYHPATIVSVDHDPDAKLRYQVYFDSMDKHSTAYCDTDAVVLDSTVKAMLVAARDSGDDPADFPDDVFMDEPDDVKATAALLGPNRHHWEAAKHKEMDGVTEEGRAVMVKSFPEDAKVLPTKLVCKKKRKPDGTLDKFKMRCTTRGDLDKSYYSDFDVFAPTANLHTFRLLMTLCILHGCMPYHYDVSQAFLQAPIPEDEQYYIKFPKQYTHPDGYIGAKMLYALYGHRTSGRLWSDTAHKFMSDNFPTLKRSTYDECLYIGTVDGKLLFVLIYVDDFVVGAQDEATRVNFHNRLMNTFTATYSGLINQFLQLKIDVTTKVNDNGDSVPVKIDISNERSIEHLAAKFQINTAKQQPRSPMLEGLNIRVPNAESIDRSIETPCGCGLFRTCGSPFGDGVSYGFGELGCNGGKRKRVGFGDEDEEAAPRRPSGGTGVAQLPVLDAARRAELAAMGETCRTVSDETLARALRGELAPEDITRPSGEQRSLAGVVTKGPLQGVNLLVSAPRRLQPLEEARISWGQHGGFTVESKAPKCKTMAEWTRGFMTVICEAPDAERESLMDFLEWAKKSSLLFCLLSFVTPGLL
ncbi:hypothetical protein CYMTET_39349 [Cymbomonas tetramitiformis]|uniref:Reverse transcriptase Ty1/copia-type domain-containing protein n=1 Tax=Cymbomonas tetramitiformis TaxID=36881 RepID=A0AAE0CBZ3_9CHLO|nr:hypothetical protein CYMTET_39349 [Cymbomonas tetramitiformis]